MSFRLRVCLHFLSKLSFERLHVVTLRNSYAGCALLPEPYRELMLSPTSPIVDFYPQDVRVSFSLRLPHRLTVRLQFKVDLTGAKREWEGVALIPFVDQQRYHRHTHTAYG